MLHPIFKVVLLNCLYAVVGSNAKQEGKCMYAHVVSIVQKMRCNPGSLNRFMSTASNCGIMTMEGSLIFYV